MDDGMDATTVWERQSNAQGEEQGMTKGGTEGYACEVV